MTATLPELDPIARPETIPAGRAARWRQPLFRSGHLLVVNSALTAISGLVYWIIAARFYPTEDVGRNLAAIAALTLLGGVAQANIMTGLLRFVPQSGAASRRVVASGYLLATVLTATAATVFVLGLGTWSADLAFLRDDPRLAVWFVASVTVWSLFSIQDHVLTAIRRTRIVPLENLVFAVVKLGLVVALAGALPRTGILVSWTIAAAAAVAVTSGYVFVRALPAHMAERPVQAPPSMRVVGRFVALDYLASLFLFATVSGLPLLVLDRVGPAATAGFLLAWTITYSLYLVPLAMGQSLVVHSADPGAEVARDLRGLVGHTLMLVVPAATLLVAFAPQMLALFGPDYVGHAGTLRLLALSAIPNVLVDLAVSSAQVRQRMRVVLAVRLAQCAGVIGTALILMPRHGVFGVGVGWLAAQTLVAVAVTTTGLLRGNPAGTIPAPRVPGPRVRESVPAPATPVSVSAIVCCYTENRWDQIVAAVHSLQAQTRPPQEILVVVDHNPVLLERARDAFPRHTVVANEGPQGLSGARNTGVVYASGDVVAFLDDDAIARPDWVAAQADAYADAAVVGTGTRIDPLWAAGRPAWFPREFDWVVGCTYTGLPTGPAEVRNVIGAGMSMRRAAVVAAGGFDPGLGRIGTVPVGCEETELCIRLRADDPDARIVLVPDALTLHHVSPERGTWRYFRARCWAEGISKARVRALAGSGTALRTEAAYVTRVLPRGVARSLLERRPRRALALIVGLTATTAGYLTARLRASRTAGIAAATLPLAGTLTLWSVALPGIDPAAMTDLGLVSVLPPAWFVALVLTIALLGVHLGHRSPGPVIALHLVGLLAILHATPAIVYGAEPRYSWTFKHLGIVDYLSRHGSLDTADPALGVYHSWPGFFTFSTMLSDTAGIDPAELARWAPPFFQVAFLIPALVAFRCLSDDPRRVWLGLSVFALTNWVGQDYFAPQAMTYLLFLTVVALVLCERENPSTGARRAGIVALLLALMLAVASSHQLTPLVLLSVLVVLALFRRTAPRWAPLAIGLIFSVWMGTMGLSYMRSHSASLLATLGRPDSNAAESLASTTLADQAVVIWAGRVLVVLVATLAVYGTVRAPRTDRIWRTWLLALAPAPLVVSSYDGEIVFRVYLFALPWIALLAAGAVFRTAHARRRVLAPVALLLAMAVPFTLAYYGKERANYYGADERAANTWLQEHAAPGAALVGVALDFPWMDRNYEQYSHVWLSQLALRERRALSTNSVGVIAQAMGDTGAFTGYLLLSASQVPALAYGSDLPPGILDVITDALVNSPDFSVVYANRSAVVFRRDFVAAEATP